MRVLPWAYLALAYAFVFLPVVVLVVFSFQDGRLPVPPFRGFSLQWYDKILADAGLMTALWNSALVAFVSSALALLMGFLAAHGLARSVLPGSVWMRGLRQFTAHVASARHPAREQRTLEMEPGRSITRSRVTTGRS